MKRKHLIRTAVIQMESQADKQANIETAENMIRIAAKQSGFILLPEVFSYRGPQSTFFEQAETMRGQTVLHFSKLAASLKIDLVLGSMLEKHTRSKKCFNTSVHIGSSGKILATYRKMHLFEAQLPDRFVSERIALIEGKKTQMTSVGPFKVGMSICYDLRFPEQYLKYALSGAQILLVPSAFTHHTGKDHWEILLRSRAIESQCYVIAPNQSGTGGNQIRMYGHSMIVDPWGRILAEASENKPDIIYADINIDTINEIRQTLPSLANRRLYKK